jgi:hypothetical protein
MKCIKVLLLVCLLGLPGVLQACPACSDAIAASSEDDDFSNLPAAINQSIYLMVSVPYITLAVVGCIIYRGCRKNAEYLASLERAPDAVPPEQA